MRHPAVRVAPGICYGRLDVALAEPVQPVLDQLPTFAGTVWSSPSRRCRRVAEAIGPHRVDSRLQELDFGAWEGLPWDAVPREALDAWAADVHGFAPPDGESGAALVARVTRFHAELPPGDHVVVSHGGPLKVLAALVRGKPVDLLAPALALGSVTKLPSR